MADAIETSSSGLKKELHDLQTELLRLLGPGIEYRCGICRKLASQHIGGVVTGCVNREIDESDVRRAMSMQIESAKDAISKVMGVGVFQLVIREGLFR